MSEALVLADFEVFITATAQSMSWGDPDLRDDLEQEGRVAVLTELAKPNAHPDIVRKRIRTEVARYAQREGIERGHLSLDDSLSGYEPARRHDTEAEALANLDRAGLRQHLTQRESDALAVDVSRGTPRNSADERAARRARAKIRRTRAPQRTQAVR